MYAVEFETDVTGRFIELKNFEQFMNQHVKVIVLAEQPENLEESEKLKRLEGYDFSKFKVKGFSNTDAVAYQRAIRDEWE